MNSVINRPGLWAELIALERRVILVLTFNAHLSLSERVFQVSVAWQIFFLLIAV